MTCEADAEVETVGGRVNTVVRKGTSVSLETGEPIVSIFVGEDVTTLFPSTSWPVHRRADGMLQVGWERCVPTSAPETSPGGDPNTALPQYRSSLPEDLGGVKDTETSGTGITRRFTTDGGPDAICSADAAVRLADGKINEVVLPASGATVRSGEAVLTPDADDSSRFGALLVPVYRRADGVLLVDWRKCEVEAAAPNP
ncbi:MAG: hypothetical protein E6J42_03740 [Chloroflexi bacterium]|nr:MAG: hypothetical protein E6J42_03740 [Chloroflexota bacterium]